MAMYQTFDGVNRRLSTPYVGIDGVQRTCDRGFVGIDGKRHQFYGILEGVTRAVFVINHVGAGDTVDNPNVTGEDDVQYIIENEVAGWSAARSIGTINYGVDSSGKLTIDIEEHVSGKSISIQGVIEIEFDNARSARLHRIMKAYIAPVMIPIQAEVSSQSIEGATEGLNTGHGVYVGNQAAWKKGSTGLGEIKRFSDAVLDHDIFQIICGIRRGSGTTKTKMILPDGIYIDNNKVPLVIRNDVT